MAGKKKNNGKSHYKQGIYEVVNKDKYIGEKNPRFLSSWEYHVFRYLDFHPSVIKWGSEVVVIKYENPVKDKVSRYMVDIYLQYTTSSGAIKEEICEIKPYKETIEPQKRSNQKKHVYERQLATYLQNHAKWEAAKEYARQRNWNWRILTEYELFKK